MPIYEYQCEVCKEIVEAWQSFRDQPITTCPSCNGIMKKLISSSSFQLKGGGWYADGYGSNSSSAKKSNGSKPADSKTDSKSPKKTESKKSSAKKSTTCSKD